MPSPLPDTLRTERLALGRWRADDLEPYAAMVAERDPRAAAAPRNGRPTREDLARTVERFAGGPGPDGLYLYAARVDDRFIGYCGLTAGQATAAEPELAYELLARDHGHGYATEAARAVVDMATSCGFSALYATVRPWNDASFRVLDKLGFVRSGRVEVDDFGESVWTVKHLREERDPAG